MIETLTKAQNARNRQKTEKENKNVTLCDNKSSSTKMLTYTITTETMITAWI